jgi:hypothetical protein
LGQLGVLALGEVDVQGDLLEGGDPLRFVGGDVLYWPQETGGGCADEDHWVDAVLEMALL